MQRAEQTRIVIDSIDGSMMASAHGESRDVAEAMVDTIIQMCRKKPFMKHLFRRALLHKWLRESPLAYLVENIGETMIGVVVLTALLYGFACFMHWLGA